MFKTKGLTLYFALSPDDRVHGPYTSLDEAKEDLIENFANREIDSLEGYSIFEGKEIFKISIQPTWTKVE